MKPINDDPAAIEAMRRILATWRIGMGPNSALLCTSPAGYVVQFWLEGEFGAPRERVMGHEDRPPAAEAAGATE